MEIHYVWPHAWVAKWVKSQGGQRSAELWRLSWQGWLFTSGLPRGKAGENRVLEWGGDASHLRSFLVRAHVWTRIMYVGWCNLQPWKHVGLGLGWSRRLAPRREVRRCDGQEGASRRSRSWAEQSNTVRDWFRCLPSNLRLQTFFFHAMLTICVGSEKLESGCEWCLGFDLRRPK